MAYKRIMFQINFWEKHKYIGIYGKPKAHSLVCGRVVTPLPRVTTLVLGIGITYMQNNYKNVNFKAHDQPLEITSHTMLQWGI